jgi:DNA primase
MAVRRTTANSTLLEVLTYGEGEERSFRCEVHDDTNASASVNVLKGVWYCYSCQASGKVGDKTVPNAKLLLSMVNPQEAARVYPESYLDLFDSDRGNFGRRFSPETRALLRLGWDPFSGDSTFPVRDADGRLAGVGRRREMGEPRYVYPTNWSASRSLFLGPKNLYAHGYLVLVEGAADASSLIELGIPAAGCYSAGLHLPQQELIRRMNLRVLVLGYDADEAGKRAIEKTIPLVSDLCPIVVADWALADAKDPAATPADSRRRIVNDALENT